MPKFLVEGSYVGDGVEGLRKEGGSARRAMAERACASVGGTLESFYFAFGERDFVAIVDYPDNVTAAGVALFVGASGGIDTRTTVLVSPEEIDAAAKVRVDFRRPGG